MAGAHGRPHSRRGQTSHPLLALLRKPRESRSDRGVGPPGRASPRQEALFAELGEAYQQGVPTPTREVVRLPVDDEGREIQAG
jgi:hypothetical protein